MGHHCLHRQTVSPILHSGKMEMKKVNECKYSCTHNKNAVSESQLQLWEEGVFKILKRPQTFAEQNIKAIWMTISDFMALMAFMRSMGIFKSKKKKKKLERWKQLHLAFSKSFYWHSDIHERHSVLESRFPNHRFQLESFHYSQSKQQPMDVTKISNSLTSLRLLNAWFGWQHSRHPRPMCKVGRGWKRPQTRGWNRPRFPFGGSQHQPHWSVAKSCTWHTPVV